MNAATTNWPRFSVAAILLLCAAIAHTMDLPIVPAPQEAIPGKGVFTFAGSRPVIRLSVAEKVLHATTQETLEQTLQEQGFKKPLYQSRGIPVIWLGIPAESSDFETHVRNLKIWPENRIDAEGYVLVINESQITLAANTPAGLFYGTQSLVQLLRGAEQLGQLPVLTIIDWPDIPFRGVNDDISRGPIPTMEFFKEQIRRCAELKLNLLGHYVENVVITASHPDMVAPGGGLTLDEWRELKEFAARYHVQLLGGFQSFGHFKNILSYPQYSHLGEAGRMLSPVKEESYRFLEDIYNEFVPVFDTPWFNVNCDETWDLGRLESKARVDSLGIGVVYAEHINRLDGLLKKHGKRTMLWADIALAHPEALTLLPADAVFIAWEYSDLDSYQHLLEPLQATGHDIFISPGVLNSNRMMPDYSQTLGNIRGFIQAGANYDVKGVLNTVWDDGGMAFFSRDWYGVAYAADLCWNAEAGEKNGFENRFSRAFHGDSRSTVTNVINLLSRLTDFAPTQEMNEQVFWSRLVPMRGDRLRLSLNDWDDVLEICTEVDRVLSQDAPKYRGVDLDYFQIVANQYRYMAEARKNLGAAAEHYRQACFSQLTDKPRTRDHLKSALEIIGGTYKALSDLRSRFAQLWLQENRPYWLDHNLEKYDERLADLHDAEAKLLAALADFNQGHALPPPNEVRLDIKLVTARYFQNWLMCGAFPYDRKRDDNPDYLSPMGGVADARPTVYSVIELDGNEYHWTKIFSPEYGIVDLAKIYERNRHAVAYAYARIESDKAQTVLATLGSNDGIEVVLNGQLVYENHVMRSLTPDEDSLELPLMQGRNHLMLVIDQGNGDWGFSFQLPTVKVRNHDYKYRILP